MAQGKKTTFNFDIDSNLQKFLEELRRAHNTTSATVARGGQQFISSVEAMERSLTGTFNKGLSVLKQEFVFLSKTGGNTADTVKFLDMWTTRYAKSLETLRNASRNVRLEEEKRTSPKGAGAAAVASRFNQSPEMQRIVREAMAIKGLKDAGIDQAIEEMMRKKDPRLQVPAFFGKFDKLFSSLLIKVGIFWSAIAAGQQVFASLGATVNTVVNAEKFTNTLKTYLLLSDRTSDSLNNLGKTFDAIGGTVDRFTLSQGIARARMAGLAEDTIPQIASASRILSKAVGVDATEAFSRLSRGIAKQEVEILDELGLVVRLNDALKEYANANNRTVESLSAQERQVAFTNHVLGIMGQRYAQIGMSTTSAADKAAELSAKWKELSGRFGQGFLRPVGLFFTDVGIKFTDFLGWLSDANNKVDVVSLSLKAATATVTDFGGSLGKVFNKNQLTIHEFTGEIRRLSEQVNNSKPGTLDYELSLRALNEALGKIRLTFPELNSLISTNNFLKKESINLLEQELIKLEERNNIINQLNLQEREKILQNTNALLIEAAASVTTIENRIARAFSEENIDLEGIRKLNKELEAAKGEVATIMSLQGGLIASIPGVPPSQTSNVQAMTQMVRFFRQLAAPETTVGVLPGAKYSGIAEFMKRQLPFASGAILESMSPFPTAPVPGIKKNLQRIQDEIISSDISASSKSAIVQKIQELLTIDLSTTLGRRAAREVADSIQNLLQEAFIQAMPNERGVTAGSGFMRKIFDSSKVSALGPAEFSALSAMQILGLQPTPQTPVRTLNREELQKAMTDTQAAADVAEHRLRIESSREDFETRITNLKQQESKELEKVIKGSKAEDDIELKYKKIIAEETKVFAGKVKIAQDNYAAALEAANSILITSLNREGIRALLGLTEHQDFAKQVFGAERESGQKVESARIEKGNAARQYIEALIGVSEVSQEGIDNQIRKDIDRITKIAKDEISKQVVDIKQAASQAKRATGDDMIGALTGLSTLEQNRSKITQAIETFSQEFRSIYQKAGKSLGIEEVFNTAMEELRRNLDETEKDLKDTFGADKEGAVRNIRDSIVDLSTKSGDLKDDVGNLNDKLSILYDTAGTTGVRTISSIADKIKSLNLQNLSLNESVDDLVKRAKSQKDAVDALIKGVDLAAKAHGGYSTELLVFKDALSSLSNTYATQISKLSSFRTLIDEIKDKGIKGLKERFKELSESIDKEFIVSLRKLDLQVEKLLGGESNFILLMDALQGKIKPRLSFGGGVLPNINTRGELEDYLNSLEQQAETIQSRIVSLEEERDNAVANLTGDEQAQAQDQFNRSISDLNERYTRLQSTIKSLTDDFDNLASTLERKEFDNFLNDTRVDVYNDSVEVLDDKIRNLAKAYELLQTEAGPFLPGQVTANKERSGAVSSLIELIEELKEAKRQSEKVEEELRNLERIRTEKFNVSRSTAGLLPGSAGQVVTSGIDIYQAFSTIRRERNFVGPRTPSDTTLSTLTQMASATTAIGAGITIGAIAWNAFNAKAEEAKQRMLEIAEEAKQIGDAISGAIAEGFDSGAESIGDFIRQFAATKFKQQLASTIFEASSVGDLSRNLGGIEVDTRAAANELNKLALEFNGMGEEAVRFGRHLISLNPKIGKQEFLKRLAGLQVGGGFPFLGQLADPDFAMRLYSNLIKQSSARGRLPDVLGGLVSATDDLIGQFEASQGAWEQFAEKLGISTGRKFETGMPTATFRAITEPQADILMSLTVQMRDYQEKIEYNTRRTFEVLANDVVSAIVRSGGVVGAAPAMSREIRQDIDMELANGGIKG